MPGFILNAIGSAAGAAGDIYGEERRAETNLNNQKAAADYSSQLEMRRQEAIQRLKLENIPLEAKARDEADAASQAASAERFNKARDGIINKRVDAALGPEFQGNASVMNDRQVADIERMSTERKAKGDKLREGMRNDASVMREAGLESGQISPKEAATMAGSAEIAQMRADVQNAKNDQLREMAQAKLDTALAIANLRAANSGGDRQGSKDAMLNLNTTVSTQQRIIKDGQEELKTTRKGTPEYTALQERIRSAQEISDIASRAIKGKLGEPDTGDKPAATPAQSNKPAISKLPPGAKQVGTSGGRPVFETPDGKRYIQ